MIKHVSNLLILIIVGIILFSPSVMAENMTVTDIAGNEISLPSEISRAITIDPFFSQFITLLGADNKLVATCIGPHDNDVLNKTEPYLGSLPNGGCKDWVNVEQIMAYKPDVVISTAGYKQANEKIRNAGIPIVLIDVEKQENFGKSYELMGKLFGKEKEAKKFNEYYQSKLKQIKKDVSNLTEDRKKSVYIGGINPQETVGSGWYETEMTNMVNGKNVAVSLTGGDNKVSMDQIYTWNPDTIVLLPYCTSTVDDILSDPAWQSLKAVKEKKVYRMPKYIMSWQLPVPE